jgi:hypothetical protein
MDCGLIATSDSRDRASRGSQASEDEGTEVMRPSVFYVTVESVSEDRRLRCS